MLKNVQQFFGFNLDENENDDEDDILDINFNSNSVQPKQVIKESKRISHSKSTENKTQSTPQQKQFNFEIKIASPLNYEESLNIASILREGTPIIVKCDQLNAEDSKRLIDFLCGTAYAINGQMEKISDKIVIFSPETTGLITYENTIHSQPEKEHHITQNSHHTSPMNNPQYNQNTNGYPSSSTNFTPNITPNITTNQTHPQTSYAGPTPTYNAEQVATPYANENEPHNFSNNQNSSLTNSW